MIFYFTVSPLVRWE